MAKRKLNPPSSPRRISSLMREEAALRQRALRRPYAAIGRDLGVDRSTAFRLVMRGLERLRAECNEQAAMVREIDLVGLDEFQSRLAPAIEKGDVPSVLAALKCQERRAKLLGLDAPTKTDNASVNVNANADAALMTRAEMAEAFKKSRDRLEAARQAAQRNA